MTTITLPMTPDELDTLKWVSRAAAKDGYPAVMVWTVIDTARMKVYASDLYRIHFADLKAKDAPTLANFHDLAGVKRPAGKILVKIVSAEKVGKRAKSQNVTLEIDDTPDTTDYPDKSIFDRLIPRPEKYTGGYAVGINPKYLTDAAPDGAVVLDCQPDNTALFTAHIPSHSDRMAVIMPMQVANAGSLVTPAPAAPAPASEIAELKADLAAVNADRDRLTAELAALKASRPAVKPAPDESAAVIEKLRREIADWKTTAESEREDCAAARAELSDLVAQLELEKRITFEGDTADRDYLRQIYDLKAELAAARHNLIIPAPAPAPVVIPADTAALEKELRKAREQAYNWKNSFDGLQRAFNQMLNSKRTTATA